MLRSSVITSFCLLLLVACGDNPDSQIVGVMVSPVSAQVTVGTATGFIASVQYVDGHHTPLSSASWSIQGTASVVISTSGANVTVECVRPSDYFAGGYVPDTVMGRAEVNGQTYTGTASLVCR
jgi:hypothetical protein